MSHLQVPADGHVRRRLPWLDRVADLQKGGGGNGLGATRYSRVQLQHPLTPCLAHGVAPPWQPLRNVTNSSLPMGVGVGPGTLSSIFRLHSSSAAARPGRAWWAGPRTCARTCVLVMRARSSSRARPSVASHPRARPISDCARGRAWQHACTPLRAVERRSRFDHTHACDLQTLH